MRSTGAGTNGRKTAPRGVEGAVELSMGHLSIILCDKPGWNNEGMGIREPETRGAASRRRQSGFRRGLLMSLSMRSPIVYGAHFVKVSTSYNQLDVIARLDDMSARQPSCTTSTCPVIFGPTYRGISKNKVVLVLSPLRFACVRYTISFVMSSAHGMDQKGR